MIRTIRDAYLTARGQAPRFVQKTVERGVGSGRLSDLLRRAGSSRDVDPAGVIRIDRVSEHHTAQWMSRDGKTSIRLEVFFTDEDTIQNTIQNTVDPFVEVLHAYVHVLNSLLDQKRPEKKPERIVMGIALFGTKRKLFDVAKDGRRGVGPEHTVAGVTYFDGNSTSVHDSIVFREEDWAKVVLHELVHAYGLDDYAVGSQQIQLETAWKAKYKLRVSDLHLHEAHTEALAALLYLVMHVASRSTSADFSQRFCKKFEAFLVKFIDTAHMLYFTCRDASGFFTERAASFSYYVVKCALLLNLERYVAFCSEDLFIENAHKYYTLVDESLQTLTEMWDEYVPSKVPRSKVSIRLMYGLPL